MLYLKVFGISISTACFPVHRTGFCNAGFGSTYFPISIPHSIISVLFKNVSRAVSSYVPKKESITKLITGRCDCGVIMLCLTPMMYSASVLASIVCGM